MISHGGLLGRWYCAFTSPLVVGELCVFREGEVVEVVRRFLVGAGYMLCFWASGRGQRLWRIEGGLLVVEVRGVPTDVKVRGRGVGMPKSKATVR